MSAPSYEALYDFETQMEQAWQAVFIAEVADSTTIGDNVNVTRDYSTLKSPRIEVEFIVGGALKQRKFFAGPPRREVPNAFGGILVVRVVTTRPLQESTSQHGQIRGFARYVMTSAANKIKAQTNLPYLQILDLLPATTHARIIDDKEQDISELQYAMDFAINDTAWPA